MSAMTRKFANLSYKQIDALKKIEDWTVFFPSRQSQSSIENGKPPSNVALNVSIQIFPWSDSSKMSKYVWQFSHTQDLSTLAEWLRPWNQHMILQS
jgi:hypothetical protein